MRQGAAYDGGGGAGGAGAPGAVGAAPTEQSCLEQLLCALCAPICKEVGVDLQQVQAQNQEQVHLTQPQANGQGITRLPSLAQGRAIGTYPLAVRSNTPAVVLR